ncbi:MAG: hypothetical protein RMJ19_05230 [Gemmatales bacterium]|nr:hypothetical protein [Gemmatales bacterium]MDW8175055.1 hypothetical protein [Gemmatales bacterium]
MILKFGKALRDCLPKVQDLLQRRVMLHHDLAGCIYHTLLGDIARPLGAYYTSVAAATLLLRSALAPERWNLDWNKLESVGRFRSGGLSVRYGDVAYGSNADADG